MSALTKNMNADLSGVADQDKVNVDKKTKTKIISRKVTKKIVTHRQPVAKNKEN